MFVITEVTPQDRRHPRLRRLVRHYFQDRKGRLELSRSDLDARWRTQSHGKKARLSYKQHVIVDRRGFILAQEMTRASEVEAEPMLALLPDLPVRMQSLSADTGYSRGKLRRALANCQVQTFIPMHPRQLSYRVHTEGFTYHGDHLVCPQGKVLNRSHFNAKHECWFYAAKQKDCQACAVKGRCLPPKSKRRFVQLSQYHNEFQAALDTMKTARFKRAMRTRKTVVEGVFAQLDRMAFDKVKRRGLEAK